MGLAVCSITSCSGSSSSLVSMEIRWVRRSKSNSNVLNTSPGKFTELNTMSKSPLAIPVYISTQREDVNLKELRDLYKHCNHSCHRFPNVDSKSGTVKEVVDIDKLRKAISNSTVLVSVFCKPQNCDLMDVSCSDEQKVGDAAVLYSEEDKISSSDRERQNKGISSLQDLLQKVMPVTPSNGMLVGFGRVVSDCGLTASIFDVMVIPSLRGMGIGKLIVRRILRILTSRDIYDIAALCSERERLFFKACGFGDDILGSTTMMYTNTPQTSIDQDDQLVRFAGRKILLAPPPRKPFGSSETPNGVS